MLQYDDLQEKEFSEILCISLYLYFVFSTHEHKNKTIESNCQYNFCYIDFKTLKETSFIPNRKLIAKIYNHNYLIYNTL